VRERLATKSTQSNLGGSASPKRTVCGPPNPAAASLAAIWSSGWPSSRLPGARRSRRPWQSARRGDLLSGFAGAEIIDHVEAGVARRLQAVEEIASGRHSQTGLHRVEIGAVFEQFLELFPAQQRDPGLAMMLANGARASQHAHDVGQPAVMQDQDLFLLGSLAAMALLY
jgi:hypothetical protein